MPRWATVGLVVVGLGTGIWLLWPDGDQAGATSTTVLAAGTTTSTAVESAVTTTIPAPTTAAGTHVVETVEEAEEILRELWFGWFEGIYNQDEDRIREVVATEEQAAAAVDQFGVMEFLKEPQQEDLGFAGTEILRSDAECLAVWTVVDAAFRPGSGDRVHIIRRDAGTWRFAAFWSHRNDLWEPDCEALLS